MVRLRGGDVVEVPLEADEALPLKPLGLALSPRFLVLRAVMMFPFCLPVSSLGCSL